MRKLVFRLVYFFVRKAAALPPLRAMLARIVSILASDGDFFDACQARGAHVTPVHYYQPIPDTRQLTEQRCGVRSEMIGVDLREESQLEFLANICAAFRQEYDAFPDEKTACPYEFYFNQNGFRSNDSEILYSIIRKFRPKRMIEVGSGMSTMVAAAAIRMNKESHGVDCRLTAIEPFPRELLRDGFPGLSDLIVAPVEDVPLALFAELDENDILFIDSSHVVRVGGDVLWEYLEVIPRLKAGVLIHCHDIFLPAHYPRDWMVKLHWFWTEQYLLQALLAGNTHFEVVWAGSYMHLNHPERLEACFRAYRKDVEWPGSFWIRKIR